MIAIAQRVSRAEVRVAAEVVGGIDKGVLLLVAVERGDAEADADLLARKLVGLRIFPGRTPMDLSLKDVGGACLVVSQFTLPACRRPHRCQRHLGIMRPFWGQHGRRAGQ
jgi:D-tyrosyl-tRNA(Tyr) deacylase